MSLMYRQVLLTSSFTIALLLTVLGSAEKYPEEEYGYIPMGGVSGSAYFYSIKGNKDASKRQQQPLVMWLQGGPGGSSLFSDFLETGPQMIVAANNSQGYDLVPRPHAWTRHATMLYVDNPIGTGFSYAQDANGYARTDDEIGKTLVIFLGKFFGHHPEYLENDFWIFCESYGGKMTAYFGAELAKSISKNSFPYPQLKFKGVEIGDGWISPIDCMYSYGPYLLNYAQVSPSESINVTNFAANAQQAMDQHDTARATTWWKEQQSFVSSITAGVNWYNVLTYENYVPEDAMNQYINDNLSKKLKQAGIVPDKIIFGQHSDLVFGKLYNAFMTSAVEQVSYLLQNGYAVHVLSGQIDLIVNPVCADKWIARLDWADLQKFFQQQRVPIKGRGIPSVGGFRQSYKNFNVWTINGAGHMVPTDNPAAAELMFASIIGSTELPEPMFQIPASLTRLQRRARNRKLYKP